MQKAPSEPRFRNSHDRTFEKSIDMNAAVPGVAALILMCGFNQAQAQSKKSCTGGEPCCGKAKPEVLTTSASKLLVCKLTGKEMQERKEGLIAALKKTIVERSELPNGYSFRFGNDDASIDRLVAFVKSERQCCGFFTFGLVITEEYAQLDLTGPEGAKEFVTSEIGL